MANGEGLPNFMIVGAVKAGTTSLYWYLGQHPDVCLTKPKEPRFFERSSEFEQGMDHYRRTYLPHWKGERAIGEARPVHLMLPYVAARIHQTLPDLKIIAVLRDPVDRAFSNWWMKHSAGLDRLSFEDAIAENLRQVERGRTWDGLEGERRWEAGFCADGRHFNERVYLEMGYYAAQVERYRTLFGADRVRVVLYDDLRHDTERVVRELWRFVGVDADVPFTDATPANVAVTPAMLPLFRLAQAARLPTLLPPKVGHRLRSWASRFGRKAEMDPVTRAALAAHYEPYTRRLESILDRDLSTWQRAA